MGTPETTQIRKLRVRWAIKLGISATLLGVIFWLLPTEQVWHSIAHIPIGLLAIVFVLFLAGHAVAAAKWWLLVADSSSVSYTTALRAHMAGLAANLCLPGVAGGDVIRAGIVFHKSDDKARVAVGSLTDRLLDIIALLVLAGLGAVMTFGAHGLSGGPLALAVAFVLLTIIGCALVAAYLPRFAKGGCLAKLAAAIEAFRHRLGRLILCLSLSILIQAGFIALNVTLATASGLTAPASAWYYAWPLAKLIATLPISFAGLGVREASLAALLAPLGADAAKVVAVGLLWQAVIFATGIVGALLLLVTGKQNQTAGTANTSGNQISAHDLARRDG